MIQKYTSLLVSSIGRFGTVKKGLVRLGFYNGDLVAQSYLGVKTPIGGASYTIAQLTALSSPLAGTRAIVTNASVTTFLTALGTTTGSNVVPVFHNGTAWIVG